ncbi:hypothetical protein BKA83DRAFT_4225760 [Pisolithus microcarpus]|nr:hypothetical protein BKA83DRAFT_4225760 [Pisolithus microcarpus]
MSASLISFPTSESAPGIPSPPIVTHYLPFRRISLPTVPGPPQCTSNISSHVPTQHRTRTKRVHRHRRPSADDARDARRDKIITEFYETEKSYFNGLDLVYNHFLTPILASLSTPNPLLTRQELTTLFSNFIDIWNFHRTFVAALTEHLQFKSTPLSAVLLLYFPYLSLYTPFITSFPASLTFLTSLSSIGASPNPHFTAFLRTQESHPCCAHLRLSDYLLTPVQRCPRYLLLLKDILQAMDPTSTEHEALQQALGLVEKITTSLNTSLMTHTQTLTLLNLQRNTYNLPSSLSPLVAPGRDLLKRGTLTCQGSSSSVTYEFFLMTDHLIWLSRDEVNNGPGLLKSRSSPCGQNGRRLYAGHIDLVDVEVVMTIVHNDVTPRLDILSPRGSFALYAPAVSATKEQRLSQEREILEAWLTSLRAARATRLTTLARLNPDSTLSSSGSNVHIRQALRAFAHECSEPWGSPLEFERMASPQHSSDASGSFAEEPRGDLFTQAAPQSSQTYARRAHIDNFLPPVWTPDAKANKCMRCGRPFGFVLDLKLGDMFGWRSTTVSFGDDSNAKTERGKERGRGAWRRKHHCRICGRVVCAACSGKTFYMSCVDANPSAVKEKPKPARACTECYDTTFPFLPGPAVPEPGPNVKHKVRNSIGGSRARPSTAAVTASNTGAIENERGTGGGDDPDTFIGAHGLDSTMRAIPPWLSLPTRRSLDVSEALMAMDSGSCAEQHRRSIRVNGTSMNGHENEAGGDDDIDVGAGAYPREDNHSGGSPKVQRSTARSDSIPNTSSPSSSTLVRAHKCVHTHEPVETWTCEPICLCTDPQQFKRVRDRLPASTRPIRIRLSARPRSYHDILDDFAMHGSEGPGVDMGPGVGTGSSLGFSDGGESDNSSNAGGRPTIANGSMNTSGTPRPRPRPKTSTTEEDAEWRRKRFSLPAVALQTNPVFAHAIGGYRNASAEVEDSDRDVRNWKDMDISEGGLLARRRDSSAMGMLNDVLKGASTLKV